MKSWLWALLVLIPLWGTSQTQTPDQAGPVLSLDEAIGVAEHNAFSLKTAASGVEQAHQGVNAAKGLLGPTLSASANYTHILDHSNLGNFSGAGTTGATTGTTGSTGTSSLSALDFVDTQEAIISFSLPIDISGVMLKGVRAAQASYSASKANFAAADNDLRLSVRQAYFQIVQDKAQINVATESVQNAQQTLTNAQEKLTAGTLARYDVLQYETQLSQSQSDLITAQTNLAVAKENFNNILARPINTPFDVADVTALPEVTDSPENLIQSAVANRPDVLSQKETIQSLKYQTQATEAGMDPTCRLRPLPHPNLRPGHFQHRVLRNRSVHQPQHSHLGLGSNARQGQGVPAADRTGANRA